MPNTFKNYYFAASSDDENDNKFTIAESKSLKRSFSPHNINRFFDEPKSKKTIKGQCSTVGQARDGGMV